ncbi:hypothetical protein GCM10009864_25170 [Streptomyces lunalinharesii]|uniref:Transposase n=1 Tax=Streptomyces lunalinharesii TaxID=333384 RepID=A0ABP6E5A1_9ACTN
MQAKAEELGVSERWLWKRWAQRTEQGLWALVDKRKTRIRNPLRNLDTSRPSSSAIAPPVPYPTAAIWSGSVRGSARSTSSAAWPMPRIRSGSASSGMQRASISSGSPK